MKAIVLFVGLICVLCLFQVINAAPDGADVGEPEEAQLPTLEEQPLSKLTREKRAKARPKFNFNIRVSRKERKDCDCPK